MKRTTQFFGLALAGALALLLPLQAQAICGTPTSFASYYNPITNTTFGASLRANFWSLSSGNPAIGAGNDNGAIGQELWILPYAGGMVVQSTWQAQNYDGCPDAAEPNAALQRMVMGLSDVDVNGNMTYAVACTSRDVTAATQFNFTTGTNGQPIALKPAEKARVTNTVRAGNEATITVGVPDFSPGFYTNGSVGCEKDNVIPQFDVYKQQTARNVAPAATNDAAVGGPWVLAATCNVSGSPACTVTTTCGTTNCDNYLAIVPHYNSGFTTANAATGGAPRVSQSSVKVAAGPVLAVTPKPKAIPNPRVEAPRTQQNQ